MRFKRRGEANVRVGLQHNTPRIPARPIAFLQSVIQIRCEELAGEMQLSNLKS
jgi:hypothetical protein